MLIFSFFIFVISYSYNELMGSGTSSYLSIEWEPQLFPDILFYAIQFIARELIGIVGNRPFILSLTV